MFLKIVADGLTTVIDGASRVKAGRDDEKKFFIDVFKGDDQEPQRHIVTETAYLMNNRGDTIDTFRCAR